jgi:excinuclease UvrABC nuclease subunit
MTSEEFADYIARTCTSRIELDARKVPLFNKPIVYMAMSKDECLYIGMSTKGLGRVFSRDHHVLSKIYDQVVILHVYETIDDQAAHDLEAKMIQEFKPKYNDRLCMRPTKLKDGPNAAKIIAHCHA